MGGHTSFLLLPFHGGKMKAGVPTPFFLFLVRPLLCPLSIHGCPFPVFLPALAPLPPTRANPPLTLQLSDFPTSRKAEKLANWQAHHQPPRMGEPPPYRSHFITPYTCLRSPYPPPGRPSAAKRPTACARSSYPRVNHQTRRPPRLCYPPTSSTSRRAPPVTRPRRPARCTQQRRSATP